MNATLPDWLDDIHGFLARLRGAPLRIGVGEEARVLWLLDRLRESRNPPQTVEALGQWLGPVCCTSPRQQSQFADELGRWAREHSAEPDAGERSRTVVAALPAPVAALQRASLAGRWLLSAGTAVLLGVLLLVAAWVWRVGERVPDLAPAATAASAAAPAATWMPVTAAWLGRAAERGAPLGLLLVFLWWQRRRPQSLARRFVAAATPGQAVGLRAARRLLFAPGTLSHHFQALRRHHDVPSRSIDVARSLRATLRAGGAVQLRFGTQRRLPDYLVMIDRVSLDDHLGALADVVVRRLDEEQVPCSRYDFHGDPRRARARQAGTGARGVVDLADLAAVHGEHPLMLFTEAERFFSHHGTQTQAWVDQLLAWPLTLIFTPKPQAEWGPREQRLQAMGLVVLPATPAGIALFADLLRAGSAEPVPVAAATTLAPPLQLLSVRPDRWVRQTAPGPRELDQLLAALQAGLGAGPFLLLCATAVFPTVNAEVTLWLADALGGAAGAVDGARGGANDGANDGAVDGAVDGANDGAALLDEESFGRLARLPWLRRGRMPDWLRVALIARLGPAREGQVRALCLQLLQPRGDGGDGFDLDIAAGDHRAWLATLLAVLRQDDASALRDAVFLGFVRGQAVDPLALRAPGELSRLLRAPLPGRLEWLAIAAALLVTAVLWRYDLQLGAVLVRAGTWLAQRLQLDGEVRIRLAIVASATVAAALLMWHLAVLGDGPRPRPRWLLGARVAAGGAALAAAALSGVAWVDDAALLLAAALVVALTWLPTRPADKGRPLVRLANLTRAGGWFVTSVGAGVLLSLFLGGYAGGLQFLSGAAFFNVDWLQGSLSAVAMPVALTVAALAAGDRLKAGLWVSLVCAAAATAATVVCFVFCLLPLQGFAVEPRASAMLAVPLLVAAGWGAMLALWQCGVAQRPWLARLAYLLAALLAWDGMLLFAFDEANPWLPRRWTPPLLALPVLMVFVLLVWRRQTALSFFGPRIVQVERTLPTDASWQPVTWPRLRLVWACGVVLAGPLLVGLAGSGDAVAGASGWALACGSVCSLLLPALRIAAPDLFRPRQAPWPAAGRAPRWQAWACAPLLWLLSGSYDFGVLQVPQALYLFVPIAAWWAHRFGRAGLAAFVAGSWLLLLSSTIGPVQIGNATGIFLAAVIVFRLVSEPDYRQATASARAFGVRQLLYVLLVGGLTVYVPGSSSFMRLGSPWPVYLTLLLLLVGQTRAVPRALPWALAVGLVFGLWLRLTPLPGTGSALFEQIGVGYGINDPSILVGGLLALYGPAFMRRRSEQAQADKRVPPLLSLPYLLLALGLLDVYFGLAVDVTAGASLSVFNLSGLMVVAFLIGGHDHAAGMRRVVALLLTLVLAAALIDIAAATLNANARFGFGLRWAVNAVTVAQGAVVVAAYAWLGARLAANAGPPDAAAATAGATATAAPVPLPVPLPQLRFAYMDLVLMAAAAVLLLLRAAAVLAPAAAP